MSKTIALNLEAGMNLSIRLGGAATYSCVVSEMIHIEIVKTTEKAVECKIFMADNNKFEGKTFWLPRKAVQVTRHDQYGTVAQLAVWFRPDGWTDRCLTHGHSVAAISASVA